MRKLLVLGLIVGIPLGTVARASSDALSNMPADVQKLYHQVEADRAKADSYPETIDGYEKKTALYDKVLDEQQQLHALLFKKMDRLDIMTMSGFFDMDELDDLREAYTETQLSYEKDARHLAYLKRSGAKRRHIAAAESKLKGPAIVNLIAGSGMVGYQRVQYENHNDDVQKAMAQYDSMLKVYESSLHSPYNDQKEMTDAYAKATATAFGMTFPVEVTHSGGDGN